jgi:hypothetical protein
MRFIARSPKKSAETANVPEHPSSAFVVGRAMNALEE